VRLRSGLCYRSQGCDLEYDLFLPDRDRAPLVVFLHGGGWISGERSMYHEEAAWFAENGFAGACIEYRLAPLYPYPAAVLDAQAFLAHARTEGAALGLDPARVAAFGNSAGGHLAQMLGLCRVAEGGGLAKPADAFVSVCGISDLRPGDAADPLAMGFIEQFMAGPYAGNEAAYEAASPIAHDPVCGPALLFHGAEDDIVPVEQSRRLAARLSEFGNDVQYVELQGEYHSFSLPAWEHIREESLAFLRRVFGP
jgi:acetyl esterase/lipase